MKITEVLEKVRMMPLIFYLITTNKQIKLLEKYPPVVYYKIIWQENWEIKIQWQPVRNRYTHTIINLTLQLEENNLFGVGKIRILLIHILIRVLTVKSLKVDIKHLMHPIENKIQLWDHPIEEWLTFRRENDYRIQWCQTKETFLTVNQVNKEVFFLKCHHLTWKVKLI